MYICTSVWICFFFFLLSCKICFLFIFVLVYSLFVVLFLFTLFHSFLFKVCSIFYSFRTRFGKVFTYVHWFGFVSFSSFFSLPSPLRFVPSSFASFKICSIFFSFCILVYSLFILNKTWKSIYIDLNLFLFFLFSLFHFLLFKVCSIFYSFSFSFSFLSFLIYSLFVSSEIWKNIYMWTLVWICFFFFFFFFLSSIPFKICSIFYSFSPSSILYLFRMRLEKVFLFPLRFVPFFIHFRLSFILLYNFFFYSFSSFFSLPSLLLQNFFHLLFIFALVYTLFVVSFWTWKNTYICTLVWIYFLFYFFFLSSIPFSFKVCTIFYSFSPIFFVYSLFVVLFLLFSLFYPFLFKIYSIFYSFSPSSILYSFRIKTWKII